MMPMEVSHAEASAYSEGAADAVFTTARATPAAAHAFRPAFGAAGTQAAETLLREPAERAGYGKVGRNQPCPCGSGKKYKHCHGAIV
jgi:preprotein translocase subunit SecA